MLKKLHKHYHEGKLTLKDYLAAHRTLLANDRTQLSYVRTSLTLFIAGVTFIRFFGSTIFTVIGWVFIPAGIIVFVIGIYKYHHVRYLIHSIKHDKKAIKKI